MSQLQQSINETQQLLQIYKKRKLSELKYQARISKSKQTSPTSMFKRRQRIVVESLLKDSSTASTQRMKQSGSSSVKVSQENIQRNSVPSLEKNKGFQRQSGINYFLQPRVAASQKSTPKHNQQKKQLIQEEVIDKELFGGDNQLNVDLLHSNDHLTSNYGISKSNQILPHLTKSSDLLQVMQRRRSKRVSLLQTDVFHLNTGDKKIVSYMELLKQKQEDDKKMDLQRKLTRMSTSKARNASITDIRFKQMSQIDEEIKEDIQYEYKRTSPNKTTTLRQKLQDLNQMNSIREQKKDKQNSQAEIDQDQQRNQELYNLLKEYKVCVLPDPKIITLDRLPNFSIIEGNIKESLYKKSQYTKISKQNYQNINSLQNSTQFYMQINSDQFQHFAKPKGFFSSSLNSKRLKRITGVGACTRVETQEQIEEKIKQIYQQQILENEENELINQLLGPINESDIPDFHQMTPMKRLVFALKTKVSQQEVRNALIEYRENRQLQPKKTFKSVLEEYTKMNQFKKKYQYDEEQQNDEGEPRTQNNRQRKKKSNNNQYQSFITEENLPPDLRFFHKFKSIIKKQIRSMVNNSTLENAYKQEKRKLEIDILRNNEKNKVTQLIINQIDSQEALNPIPNYKYQYFQKQIKELNNLKKLQQSQLEQKTSDERAMLEMSKLKSFSSMTQNSSPSFKKKMHSSFNNLNSNLQNISFTNIEQQNESDSNLSEELLDKVFFDGNHDWNSKRIIKKRRSLSTVQLPKIANSSGIQKLIGERLHDEVLKLDQHYEHPKEQPKSLL